MVRVTKCFLWLFFVFAVAMAATTAARAQVSSNPQTPNAPGAGQGAPAFDVNAAVEAYLAKMPPAERARSNAYFEGGYWLQLWDLLLTPAISAILLRGKRPTRQPDRAPRT